MGDAEVTTEQLKQTLRTLARIVTAPRGAAYVPLFERVEAELAQREKVRDAIARARILLDE
jgi:hypothetical protein